MMHKTRCNLPPLYSVRYDLICVSPISDLTRSHGNKSYCVCVKVSFFKNTIPPDLMKYPLKDQVTPSVQKEAY